MHQALVILLAVLVLVLVVVVGFWAVAWISFGLTLLFGLFRRSDGRPTDTPEEYRARRREPQMDVLEAHFDVPVPESLRRLYRNVELLEQEEFFLSTPDAVSSNGGYFISRFLPADHKALESIPRKLDRSRFPFAEDGSGNCYCVRIPREADDACPVFLWDRRRPSTAEPMKIADSLDEFLARPRRRGHGQEQGGD